MTAFEDYANPIIKKLPTPKLKESKKPPKIPPLWETLENIEGKLSDLDDSEEVQIDDESKAAIEDAQEIYGLEIFAFYKSIHFLEKEPFKNKWGIFIFDYAIPYISNRIEQFYAGRFTKKERDDTASWLLRRHERFHFHFDAWVISHEAIQEKALYAKYLFTIYRRSHPNSICVEESLANNHIFESLENADSKTVVEMREFIERYMSEQPGAYAEYKDYIEEKRHELAMQVLEKKYKLKDLDCRILEWELDKSSFSFFPYHAPWIAYGRDSLLKDTNCPVYTIKGIRPISLIYPCITQDLKEHERFVEFYLSGKPNGQASGHKLYKIDNGELIKIPIRHSKISGLKDYELLNNIHKAGMTTKEFRDERHRTKDWKRSVPREKAKQSRYRIA